jgi:hypothetical protein
MAISDWKSAGCRVGGRSVGSFEKRAFCETHSAARPDAGLGIAGAYTLQVTFNAALENEGKLLGANSKWRLNRWWIFRFAALLEGSFQQIGNVVYNVLCRSYFQ